MTCTWQDVTAHTAALSAGADAYTHWAAAGGVRHLWPQARVGVTPPGRVNFLVRWRSDQKWYLVVNALRSERGAHGEVQVTTLPSNLDPALDFPFAALSLRLTNEENRDWTTQGQAVGDLARRLLALGAEHLELTLPVREDRRAPAGPAEPQGNVDEADAGPWPVPDSTGCFHVLGVIDDAIPFGHPDFKRHVHAVWLQGEDCFGGVSEIGLRHGAGAQPARQFIRKNHNPDGADDGDLALPQWRHLLPADGDTDTLHQKAIDLGFPQLRRRASHGAHVIGEVLGVHGSTAGAAAGGPASPTLVGVQLPWHAVQDTAGRWLGGHLLAGLVYALDCTWWLPRRRMRESSNEPRPGADARRHLVVNISYGHSTGPHDGSSLLEEALDELCRRFSDSDPQGGDAPGIRLDICLPAGNAFDAQAHAAFTLAPQAPARTLRWRVAPDGQRPTFLELWLRADDEGADADTLPGFAVEIAWPGGAPQRFDRPAGDGGQWHLTDSAARTLAFVRLCRVGAQWQVLLALEPTGLPLPPTGAELRRAAAPAGDWSVGLTNLGPAAWSVRAYVARSTPHFNSRRDGTLSWLVDPEYDPQRYLRCREDDPSPNPSPIHRRGTFSGIATGALTQVATGRIARGREGGQGRAGYAHALYASAGPSAAQPPSLAKSPDVAYVTDQSRALPGVLSAGNQGAVRVRLVGTSTASPQLARDLLAGRPLLPPSGARPVDPDVPVELAGREQR